MPPPPLPHDYHLWSLSHFIFFAKSWADDLEDMGQGQKLYMTHIHLAVNICTKY